MTGASDIIAAVSSASAGVGEVARRIVRLSGSGVWEALAGVVEGVGATPEGNTVVRCRAGVCQGVEIDAVVYCFCGPRSYTGEDTAEVHVWGAGDAAAAILERLCRRPGVRLAQPGEFTLRAYLNGKLDLMQAEAVAEIVSSANQAQLAAAEQLLRGRFSEAIGKVRGEILELLSLIEAGLDFSEEDISFISAAGAAGRIGEQRTVLQGLLEGSVRLERMIELDAAGLAGLPNAGKSSLLNALLGRTRSIVSAVEATTRDVLTGVLETGRVSCVVFDCAGLLPAGGGEGVDAMAHRAAVEALGRAELLLFCLDAGKTSFEAELEILSQVATAAMVPVATKADLADAAGLERVARFAAEHFSAALCVTSAKTGRGISELKGRIENALIIGRGGRERADRLTLNRRHADRLEEALKTLGEAADETAGGREETAAMLLRHCYETLGGLERETVSETILDRIFSRFCIGK